MKTKVQLGHLHVEPCALRAFQTWVVSWPLGQGRSGDSGTSPPGLVWFGLTLEQADLHFWFGACCCTYRRGAGSGGCQNWNGLGPTPAPTPTPTPLPGKGKCCLLPSQSHSCQALRALGSASFPSSVLPGLGVCQREG